MVFCGVSWERYLQFDKKLGDDRAVPRLYYLEAELEITTTSKEHERIKESLNGFLGEYLFHLGLDVSAPRPGHDAARPEASRR